MADPNKLKIIMYNPDEDSKFELDCAVADAACYHSTSKSKVMFGILQQELLPNDPSLRFILNQVYTKEITLKESAKRTLRFAASYSYAISTNTFKLFCLMAANGIRANGDYAIIEDDSARRRFAYEFMELIKRAEQEYEKKIPPEYTGEYYDALKRVEYEVSREAANNVDVGLAFYVDHINRWHMLYKEIPQTYLALEALVNFSREWTQYSTSTRNLIREVMVSLANDLNTEHVKDNDTECNKDELD